MNGLTRIFLLSLLLAVGCKTGGADRASPVDSDDAGRVKFSGASTLANEVQIGATTRTFAGQILHISMAAKSGVDEDVYVDYRITYFDENHNPVDLPTPWEPLTLHTDRASFIGGTASTPRARFFEIEIRPAQ